MATRMQKDLETLSSYVPRVNIVQFKQFIKERIEKKDLQSVLVWGPPGVGKTSVIFQLGQELDIPVVYKSLSQESPITAVGLFYPNEKLKVTERYPSEFMKQVLEYQKEKPVILFFDEVIEAREDTLTAVWEIINEKRFAGIKLDNVLVVGASNPNIVRMKRFNPAFWTRWYQLIVDYDPEIAAQYLGRKYPASIVGPYLHTSPEDCIVENEIFGFLMNPRQWERVCITEQKFGYKLSDEQYRYILPVPIADKFIFYKNCARDIKPIYEYFINPELIRSTFTKTEPHDDEMVKIFRQVLFTGRFVWLFDTIIEKVKQAKAISEEEAHRYLGKVVAEYILGSEGFERQPVSILITNLASELARNMVIKKFVEINRSILVSSPYIKEFTALKVKLIHQNN